MSDIFRWEERHSVGVQQFDSDHRELLDLAEKLVTGPLRGELFVEDGDVLDDLVIRAKEHFSHEERLLELVGYPHLVEHHDQHERLLQEIQAYQVAITNGKISGSDVARFIAVWIFQHIEEEDQKYRKILNENGYR